jgi:hypothetical protein
MFFNFGHIFTVFLILGVVIGMAISGLVFVGCKYVSKYDIKIEKVK